MTSRDNRRFPRIPHVTSRQIIHLDDGQNPRRHLILTENLSASGIKFTTNNLVHPAQYFLIYLNDAVMHELRALDRASARWVRAGDHYLTRVVWVLEIPATPGIFDVGAAFIERESLREDMLATFTELLNLSVLEKLPAGIAAN